MQTITVVPYDPAWPALFEQEEARLLAPLRSCIRALHHIGSTSVPGLPAKPVIDLIGEAESLEAVDAFATVFEQLGYTAMGEFGIPQRRLFIRDVDGKRTHHLHVFPASHEQVVRHLRFRDHLRENAGAANAYGELKLRLAAEHNGEKEAYISGKDPFIKQLDEQIAAQHTNKLRFYPPLQTHLLSTERLVFRHLHLLDAEEWSPFCASEEANRFFMPVEEPPLQAARTFIRKTHERWAEAGTGFCVLAEKDSGAITGLMGLLTQVVDDVPELEIGYRLLPAHWKKGYAAEAAKKFRDFAFEHRLAESIISIVHIDNIPSQRVAERNGMTRGKRTVFREIFPVYIYRITREEWEKSNSKF